MKKGIRLIAGSWSLFLGIGIVCVLYTISGIGCPILFLTGIPCLGCGMTRAILHLLRLDFQGAVMCHPMSVVLPVLVILWLYFWEKKRKRAQNAVLGIGVAMFVVVYLYRIFIMKDALLQIDINNGFLYRVVYSIVEGRKIIW